MTTKNLHPDFKGRAVSADRIEGLAVQFEIRLCRRDAAHWQAWADRVLNVERIYNIEGEPWDELAAAIAEANRYATPAA